MQRLITDYSFKSDIHKYLQSVIFQTRANSTTRKDQIIWYVDDCFKAEEIRLSMCHHVLAADSSFHVSNLFPLLTGLSDKDKKSIQDGLIKAAETCEWMAKIDNTDIDNNEFNQDMPELKMQYPDISVDSVTIDDIRRAGSDIRGLLGIALVPDTEQYDITKVPGYVAISDPTYEEKIKEDAYFVMVIEHLKNLFLLALFAENATVTDDDVASFFSSAIQKAAKATDSASVIGRQNADRFERNALALIPTILVAIKEDLLANKLREKRKADVAAKKQAEDEARRAAQQLQPSTYVKTLTRLLSATKNTPAATTSSTQDPISIASEAFIKKIIHRNQNHMENYTIKLADRNLLTLPLLAALNQYINTDNFTSFINTCDALEGLDRELLTVANLIKIATNLKKYTAQAQDLNNLFTTLSHAPVDLRIKANSQTYFDKIFTLNPEELVLHRRLIIAFCNIKKENERQDNGKLLRSLQSADNIGMWIFDNVPDFANAAEMIRHREHSTPAEKSQFKIIITDPKCIDLIFDLITQPNQPLKEVTHLIREDKEFTSMRGYFSESTPEDQCAFFIAKVRELRQRMQSSPKP